MFTVILYYEDEDARLNGREGVRSLEFQDYDFLFAHAQFENKLVKKDYSANKLVEVLSEVNQYIRDRSEWKVILFDSRIGSGKATENNVIDSPDIVRREWNKLLFCLAGQKLKDTNQLLNTLPSEIWYISCWYKGVYTDINTDWFAHAKILLTEKERDAFKTHGKNDAIDLADVKGGKEKLLEADVLDVVDVSSFRMCWAELESGIGVQSQLEEIKVSCMLQVIACNEISPVFLDNGYLFRISLDIDRKLFAQGIGRLRQQNLEAEEQIRKALAQFYMDGEPVKYIVPERLSLNFSSIKKQGKEKKSKVKLQELRRDTNILKNKLRNNQLWLNEMLYSSYDTIQREAADRLNELELSKRNYDKPIDEAGQAYIWTELENAIEDIRVWCQEKDSPQKMEKELQAREDRICELVETRLDSAERKVVWGIFAAMEGFILAIFGAEIMNKFFNPGLQQGLRYSLLYLLFWGVSWIFIVLITWVVLWLGSLVNYRLALRRYNKCLQKLARKQEKKQKTIEKLIEAIMSYKYHWTIWNGQSEIATKRERKKERIMHHAAAQRNVCDTCSRLERLLDTKETVTEGHVFFPEIDFSREPNQVECYQMSFQMNGKKCELNHSGYEVDVGFDFISGFEIHKTPSVKKVTILE